MRRTPLGVSFGLGLVGAFCAFAAVDRAAAAEPDSIDQLIRQLGSDDFEVREAASNALMKRGEAVLPALHEATASDDAEIRRRAKEMVEGIERPLAEKAQARLTALGGMIWRHRDNPEFLRVDIYGDKMTDEVLAQLKYLGGDIGYLTIADANVTDRGLAVLNHLHNLRELNLYCQKMTDAGLMHIKEFPNLRRLGLGSHKITDAGLACLKNLPHLESLSLGSDRITNDGLASLEGLSELREFGLSSEAVTDDGLKHLAELGKLISLRLQYTGVTGTGLAYLKALDKLERLDLSNSTTDDGLKALESCTCLEILFLGGNTVHDKITDKGMTHLRGVRSLTCLILTRVPITDAGLEQLKGLTSLDTLYLDGTKITDKGLVYLQEMKELRYLFLYGTSVTSKGVAVLKRLPKLTDLRFDGAPDK